MNEKGVSSDGNKKIKRQKLSKDTCDPAVVHERRLSPLLCSKKPVVMDSTGNERISNQKKFCDHTCDKSQHKSVSNGMKIVEGNLSSSDNDFVLCRRKLFCTGEDLSSILSDELMLIIFRWLTKRSLVRCAFVCKRWRRIAYDESLWSRLDLSSRVLKPGSLIHCLARGVCALRLAQSDVHAPVFPTTLIIEEQTFNKLQYLDLSMVIISGKDLAELLVTCQNIVKLSLEHCTIIEESCTAISLNTSLEVLNMPMCSGISDVGLENIVFRCKKISELNLAWTGLNSSAIRTLCIHAPQSMTRLNISGCGKHIIDEHIEQLVLSCPNLVELDISDCTSLTSTCIEYICDLKRLEHVALSRCYNIGTSSFLSLSNIESLLYLDVIGLFDDHSLNHLKQNLPNISVNKFLFSSIARPTVGGRRTSIWGLKVRK